MTDLRLSVLLDTDQASISMYEVIEEHEIEVSRADPCDVFVFSPDVA